MITKVTFVKKIKKIVNGLLEDDFELASIEGLWADFDDAYFAACREGADPRKNMIYRTKAD